MQPLHDRIDQLTTIVIRLANLVAKADGAPQPGELARLLKRAGAERVELWAVARTP